MPFFFGNFQIFAKCKFLGGARGGLPPACYGQFFALFLCGGYVINLCAKRLPDIQNLEFLCNRVSKKMLKKLAQCNEHNFFNHFFARGLKKQIKRLHENSR